MAVLRPRSFHISCRSTATPASPPPRRLLEIPEHASRTIASRYSWNHSIIGLKSAVILGGCQQMTSLLVETGRRTWLRFARGIGACVAGVWIAVFADGNAFAQASGKIPD